MKGLLSQTLFGSINYIELKKRQFHHKKLGFINFTLSAEEEDKAYSQLASVIYGDGEKFASKLILYKGKLYGILSGLMITEKGAGYAAGQHYPSEIREIKKIFNS